MQRYCTELTDRLLKSLDKEYNVVDMGAVVDVITTLEKTTITKEVLEITRLGKHINEFRRKTTNDALAKRAKDLVRRWRDMYVVPTIHSTPHPTPADIAPPALNGAKPHSPAMRSFKPQSPIFRSSNPASPLLKGTTSLRGGSPTLSEHGSRSCSPNFTLSKQPIGNHRLHTDISPKLPTANSNNTTTDAVPRTHSSNKRLRKDESYARKQHHHQKLASDEVMEVDLTWSNDSESLVGKSQQQRLNGESANSGGVNSQVPSPILVDLASETSQGESTMALPTTDLGTDTSTATAAATTDPAEVAQQQQQPEPKKRGRKKGSKGVKKTASIGDHVKEKLASISRTPKLKTTQELLADLQARGSKKSSVNAEPSQSSDPRDDPDYVGDVQRHPVRRKRARPSDDDEDEQRVVTVDGEESSRSTTALHAIAGSSREPRDLTAEEILAKLPPLDPSSIHWSDEESGPPADDASPEASRIEVTPEDLERLHAECVEGLNGNYEPRLLADSADGKSTNEKAEPDELAGPRGLNGLYRRPLKPTTPDDREFREWHEILARPSYDAQILHILPYVIID